MSERDELDLQLIAGYAKYLRDHMTDRDLGTEHPEIYSQYPHEAIHPASKWRVYTNVFVRIVNPDTRSEVPLDINDPSTYKRFIFNPYTGVNKIVNPDYVDAMRREIEKVVQDRQVQRGEGIRPPHYGA